MTFPLDEMHRHPVENDTNDDVISLVDDEDHDERGEHNEGLTVDETNVTVTDDHAATTYIHHNHSNDPHQNHPPPPAYTLRSYHRRQRFPHQ
jgi:hypothetical protein